MIKKGITSPATRFGIDTAWHGFNSIKLPVIVLEHDFVVSKDYGIRLPITDPVAEELREYYQRNFNIESVSFKRISKETWTD